MNKLRGTFTAVAVKGAGLRRPPQGDVPEDMAIFTGGQVISQDSA
jgi:hypothetical protein